MNFDNIIEIDDFLSSEFDVYARMSEAQLLNRAEPDKGIFIAESPNVVERALDAGCKPISLLMEKKHVETQCRHLIERCGPSIPVYVSEFDVLKQLTGFALTRGVLCAMKRPPLVSVEEVLSSARTIAVLENVMNPTNMGAIFRSAAALGIDGILITHASTNPLYRRAIRVSMGTVFQIPWTIIDEESYSLSSDVFSLLSSHGFKTVAMALKEDTVDINDEKILKEEKLAIILGTEGEGMFDSTIEQCDYTVKIPMSHGVDSLNVAAASAVAFWELGKR